MEIVVEILQFQYALKSYIPDVIIEKAVNLNQICQFFIKMEIVVEILHFQYALKSYIFEVIIEKAINLYQIC